MMTEKKSTKIYEAIRADIVNGRIDTRTFLNAGEIAEKYQVSKAPVRDALQVLCDQGYLVSYPRKGYMINIFSKEEVNKIQNVRRRVEAYSVELAIAHASDDAILSLKPYADRNFQMGESLYVDSLREESNNLRFHVRLAEIGGNEYLLDIVKNLAGKITMANIDTSADFSYHEKIIEALLERDVKAAVKYLEADLGTL
ncbi:GntR family transcriptional regulator [Ihubacter sp. mB4P-1]|uniref:GntR family transcriptional regulator n=1 Tax=Ihubacter sp. mB4P-1 TaxID=3242370 RepID=UPI003C7C4852